MERIKVLRLLAFREYYRLNFSEYTENITFSLNSFYY